jgi:hypothetical protein
MTAKCNIHPYRASRSQGKSSRRKCWPIQEYPAMAPKTRNGVFGVTCPRLTMPVPSSTAVTNPPSQRPRQARSKQRAGQATPRSTSFTSAKPISSRLNRLPALPSIGCAPAKRVRKSRAQPRHSTHRRLAKERVDFRSSNGRISVDEHSSALDAVATCRQPCWTGRLGNRFG